MDFDDTPIRDVIMFVTEWRKWYNGERDPTVTTRMTLEAAVAKVGWPKAALDDWLQQLKEGKKYAFDFNQQRLTLGDLRRYNLQKKSNEQGNR